MKKQQKSKHNTTKGSTIQHNTPAASKEPTVNKRITICLEMAEKNKKNKTLKNTAITLVKSTQKADLNSDT